MSKYEIAVFDVDGTLLDTTEGVVAAVKETIQTLGLPMLTQEELLTFIGPPIHDSCQRYYALEGEALLDFANTFRNLYKDKYLFGATPYEGIYDMMDALYNKGIKIAVATYKRQDYAEAILKHFHFDRYSNILYGADFDNKLKKVDIIKKCMDDLGTTDYHKAVMIGDSAHDANGAKQLGVPFLAVTYGFDFKTKEDVKAFDSIGCVDHAIDIIPFFDN